MTRCHGIFLGALFLMAMLSIAGCRDQEVAVLLPARARQGLKWGYIDEQGAFVIQPRFDEVKSFSGDGYAPVSSAGNWGLINRSGEFVLPARYDSIHDLGLYWAVKVKGKDWDLLMGRSLEVIGKGFSDWGHGSKVIPVRRTGELWMGIDAQSGKRVFPPRFRGVRYVIGKFSPATIDGTLWGFIDEKGDWSIPPEWVEVWGFQDGLAVVAVDEGREKRYGVIDTQGDYVIPPRYRRLKRLYGDIYVFWHSKESAEAEPGFEDRDQGLLNVRKGEVVPKRSKFEYRSWEDGLIVVSEQGSWMRGLIDLEGREMLPAKYEAVFPLLTNQSVALVMRSDKWGVVDHDGNLLSPMVYDGISPFVIEDDILQVKIDGVCEGYQRLSGEWVYWWELHGQSKGEFRGQYIEEDE